MKKGFAVLMAVIVAVCLGLSYGNSHASGFGIFTQDGAATSQAAAVVAHTDNPSAVFYNPALINQLPGTQVQVGTTIFFTNREFKSDLTGQTTDAESQVFFPSTFFITHAVNDKFSVGFGVYNPFGLGSNWKDNWEGRYVATNSKLTTFAFNPVVSVKLAPWITVAGGVVYMTADTTLDRNLNFQAFGLADGNERLHVTGDTLGFNAGVAIDPIKDVTIGLTYRSKMQASLRGNVNFNLPAAGGPFLAPLFPSGSANMKLDLPAQVTAGICFKQLEPLTIEIATRWEQWQAFKELSVQLAQPILGTTTDVVSERNWRNTWSGMIGLKYQVSKPLALMGGYLYQMGAVPDATFDPAIPDSNAHLFTIGAGYDVTKAMTVNVGYGYQILTKFHKNNTVDDNPSDGVLNTATAANGSYKSNINMISLSLNYRL